MKIILFCVFWQCPLYQWDFKFVKKSFCSTFFVFFSSKSVHFWFQNVSILAPSETDLPLEERSKRSKTVPRNSDQGGQSAHRSHFLITARLQLEISPQNNAVWSSPVPDLVSGLRRFRGARIERSGSRIERERERERDRGSGRDPD